MYCDYLICCVSCTVVVLTCFVMCGCVCVCGFVMCGCFDSCVGVLVIWVPVTQLLHQPLHLYKFIKFTQ